MSNKNKQRSKQRRGRSGNLPDRQTPPVVPDSESPAMVEARTIERVAAQVESFSWEGPLPPPDVLAQYDAVVPGAAARIMRMAETPIEMASSQLHHRHALEKQVIQSDIRRSWAGMALGFVLAAAIIGLGFWLILNDRPVEGFVAVIAPVAGLAAVFVNAQRKRTQEVERKRPEPRRTSRKR